MIKKAIVKVLCIAEVTIHEDATGNQEIEDYGDIRDTLEFEIIEEL